MGTQMGSVNGDLRPAENWAMRIETKREKDRTVLYLHGKVTIGVGDVMLRKAIRDLLDQGVRNIVIDFEHVTKIDSSGIAELVAAHTSVTHRGGTLKLGHLPPAFNDFFPPDFPNFPDGFAF